MLWTIEGPKLGAPEVARLSAWEDQSTNEIEEFASVLVPGEVYTIQQFKDTWVISERRTSQIVKTLTAKGYLTKEAKGWLAVELEDAKEGTDS